MDNKDMMQVPYIVYEQSEVKHERTVKRLIAALIVAIIAMVVTNGAWLYCWMQYDYSYDYTGVEKSVELESESGNANYIGNNGVINNGENKGND